MTDGMVPEVHFTDAKLRDVLKGLLWQLNLRCSVEDGFIWISTPEHLNDVAEREKVGRAGA